MPDPRDNLPSQQRLMAYADGELDADAALSAMRQVAADPAASQAVEQQLRLRQAVSRAVHAEPGPSDDLARRVSAMAFQMPAEPAGRLRWMRLGIAAAVAMLAVGILIGRFALSPDQPTVANRGVTVVPVAAVLPDEYVKSATQVHVRCSRGTDHHSGRGWPVEMASLETPVKQYANNQDLAYPDLSSIGFNYVGCATCGRPEQRGVHLVYRSVGGTDTLSLFVEPYTQQVDLPPNACRYCPKSDVHPVLVWRTEKLVFIMVGNARTPIEKARVAMKLPEPI